MVGEMRDVLWMSCFSLVFRYLTDRYMMHYITSLLCRF